MTTKQRGRGIINKMPVIRGYIRSQRLRLSSSLMSFCMGVLQAQKLYVIVKQLLLHPALSPPSPAVVVSGELTFQTTPCTNSFSSAITCEGALTSTYSGLFTYNGVSHSEGRDG